MVFRIVHIQLLLHVCGRRIDLIQERDWPREVDGECVGVNARLTPRGFSVQQGVHRQKRLSRPAGMSKYVCGPQLGGSGGGDWRIREIKKPPAEVESANGGFFNVPKGIRTPVASLKGTSPRPG